MKIKRLIAISLILVMLLSVPAFASVNRASDQIGRHDIKVTPLEGQIAIKASIYGNGSMNKLGCESIYLFKQYGSAWISNDWYLEDDYNMYSTNSPAHMANYYFHSEPGVNYKVVITMFAENDAGRDTITRTYYVTGK